MRRKVVQKVEVLVNPYHDYRGRQHTNLNCRYVNAQGTQVTGDACLQSIMEAAGIKPKPGDVLTVTIEVNAGN